MIDANVGMLLLAVTTALGGAVGSWFAVKYGLKFHDYRITKVEDQQKVNTSRILELDKKTALCKNCSGAVL